MVESSGEIITMPTSVDVGGNEDNVIDTDCKSMEEKIVAHVAASSAVFKSQQIDEPEITIEEKRCVVLNLLHKSHSQFLSRFGKYLTNELLEFFVTDDDNYEVLHYINQLKRYFDGKTRKLDRKNRRYEALRNLVDKGEYFSETAMMKRNPLLYDNLIGKYLTEGQKKARDNLDTDNITFVNLLLESIERDQIKKLKKDQEDAEDEVLEENDSDSDMDTDMDKDCAKKDCNALSWGEISHTNTSYETEEGEKRMSVPTENITAEERKMLRQEFVTQMYQSFLDGKDADFDYSLVDDNEAYDNVDLRTQDEEEQYFDSESPEWIDEPEKKTEQEESEDELDKYMKCLKEQTHTSPDRLRKSPT